MSVASESTVRQAMLAASDIAKRFGSTQALAGANLEIQSGEVHGLLGANGAGKSTLSRIISGHIRHDSGSITYRDKPFAIRSTRDALRSGIALVAQETSLAPDLSVLENIFMPEFGTRGRLSYSDLNTRAHAILSRLGHDHVLALDTEVRRLSAAQRQLVEIAKALALDANLVIFDEPTSSLSPSEVDSLFDIMSRMRNDGCGLIFVSHRLEEVLAITDRVTVMREGKTVAGNLDTSGLAQGDIIRHMVGKDLGAIYARRDPVAPASAGPAVLEVRNLAAKPAVRDVSFAVRRGEVLGLGGLIGAGRSEAVEALFGLRPRDGGTIQMHGKDINPRTPAEAMRLGIGLVAEDRRAQNIVPDFTVKENLLLAHMGMRNGVGLGYGSRQVKITELLTRLGLPPDRLDTSLLTYSGGMQQKVIIARWLLVEPTVLILDEPTKGVDIGTRSSIYAILRDIAEQGVAVIVISSDFSELLGVCERVVVMSDGLSIADLPSSVLTEEKLTLLAAPRTSTERNVQFLQSVSKEFAGTAFWALLGTEELICLGAVSSVDAPEIDLAPGQAARNDQTAIPQALAKRESRFVPEPDKAVATLLLPMRNKRGHDLGWIGLSVRNDRPLPDADEIAIRVATLTNAEAPIGVDQ
ncbi:sugar ABC transporter ATP-binding protein [Devosia naphthalenivorans]|uniref:sugar ABC transporter ATP-binding protein n=1 Tax=Devosia naphthalenivorans TaxID=2082392 RepID=UPI000D34D5A2|nr:sugar ABC transporter ATP-binding protein [Devosia naphthalenivorans]